MQSKLSLDDRLALEEQLRDAEQKLERAGQDHQANPSKDSLDAVMKQAFRVLTYQDFLGLPSTADEQMEQALGRSPAEPTTPEP